MSLAPPVVRDGFSYAADLYAEASGHSRHRRATVSEIQDHFRSGSDKDHTAHWFEAQCIHYGLNPSKTKAVARMRLLDACNADKLVVPAPIQKLEAELKKEWTRNEKALKRALKDATDSTATPASKKRKREAGTTLATPTTKSARAVKDKPAPKKPKIQPSSQSDAAQSKPSAKKQKATPSDKPSSTSVAVTQKAKTPKAKAAPAANTQPQASHSTMSAPKPKRGGLNASSAKAATTSPRTGRSVESNPKPARRPKQTARRSGAWAAMSPRTESSADSDPEPARKPKQTARCSRARAAMTIPRANSSADSPPKPARIPKQTARRSGAWAARRGITTPHINSHLNAAHGNRGADHDWQDESPPPYSLIADQGKIPYYMLEG